MLLERVWDEVQPQIVIWQLDPNDVNNNVYELDSGSFFNNQRPRPYLDLQSGRVEIRDPGFFLFDVSQLFRFVFHRLLALVALVALAAPAPTNIGYLPTSLAESSAKPSSSSTPSPWCL